MTETISDKEKEIRLKKKELKKMKRPALLEILVSQSKEIDRLKAELKEMKKELRDRKKAEVEKLLSDYINHPKVREMRAFTQHGSITTYDHCERVAEMSLKLNRRFRIGADEEKLAVGALLHDFYLYDWHDDDGGSHRLHGFTHPEQARQNAVEIFDIDEKEQEIIRTHMWPLTLNAIPKSREAAIVCLADKWCSLQETLFMR